MISVCIATHNGERFIQKQLKSILCQLNEEDEVIISDAESSDDTLKLIEALNDKRIKIFHWINQKGKSRIALFNKMDNIRNNFQNALLQAKGDVIFLSDQDDFWYKNKVERVRVTLEKFDCIVHDCSVIQGDELMLPSFIKFFKPKRSKWGMYIKSPFMGCCMAFNKSLLQYALPFPETHIEHDTWIGICAFKYRTVKVLDEVLIDYNRHGENASFCADENMNSIFIKFLRRLFMIKAYLKLKSNLKTVNR